MNRYLLAGLALLIMLSVGCSGSGQTAVAPGEDGGGDGLGGDGRRQGDGGWLGDGLELRSDGPSEDHGRSADHHPGDGHEDGIGGPDLVDGGVGDGGQEEGGEGDGGGIDGGGIDGGGDGEGPDGWEETADQLDGELPEEVVPYGAQCEDDGDCAPGICLEGPLGKLCAGPCGESCPAGWLCREVEGQELCVWPLFLYCSSCTLEEESQVPELFCAQLDGEDVMLVPCAQEGLCPGELTCKAGADGQMRCEPPSGSCSCLPGEEGSDHLCEITSGWGSCLGWKSCLGAGGWGECQGKIPQAESCNDEDDDCDGGIDEEVFDCLPQFCLQEGTSFFVKPAESCLGGKCEPAQEQNDCGLYRCDLIGALGQCLTTCTGDEQCVSFAYCSDGSSCEPKKADGGLCQEDRHCLSDHCNHGICCQSGDCCFEPDYCPSQYSLKPVCDDSESCQGHRQEAACENFTCLAGEIVADDSGCTGAVMSQECDPYLPVYCNGLEKQAAPKCANSCLTDDECADDYHCDLVCLADLPDGLSCDEGSDCQSGHCSQGICCQDGLCCDEDVDCPAEFSSPAQCDNQATCQGSRVDALCQSWICVSSDPVADDSACGAGLLAADCGSLADIFCTGETGQEAPLCPELCTDEADCDPLHACLAGQCLPRKQDGSDCKVADECLSGHCANGYCCQSGDCCTQAADCPAGYTVEPQCEEQATCQGHRLDPVCEQFSCGSLGPIADDSGCTAQLLARECAPYPDLYCTGLPAQFPPECAAACVADGECIDGAHCDGVCTPDLPDGFSCNEDSDCQSNHCSGGVCCVAGDCCLIAADCPPGYAVPPACEITSQCQGVRTDVKCDKHQCKKSGLISDDSGCSVEVQALDCAPYQPRNCTGATHQTAPSCPSACQADSDCLTGFHCDGQCLPDLPDGDQCDEDSDCLSSHCNHGLCCSQGSCCWQPEDCPGQFTQAPVCDDLELCQGSRLEALCDDFVCGSVALDDDSACGPEILLDGCALFLPITCNGQVEQSRPDCPTGCLADDECDSGAHCDELCLEDLANGLACDEPSDCLSGHCANGFCCAQGDCCASEGNCPLSYTSAPACVNKKSCQGTRQDAVCAGSICGSVTVADDSGCTAQMLADGCGPFPDLYCSGESAQEPPVCSPACNAEEECGVGYHCDTVCKADLKDGFSCDEDSDCVSGHCNSGFCCQQGNCCQFNYHCPASYIVPAICAAPTACQGHRYDRVCQNFVCLSQKVPDDSKCGVDLKALECGAYPDAWCNGQAYQVEAQCPASCLWDSQCADGYHCDGTCVADLPDGGVCNEHSDCSSGLCTNGHCTGGGIGCALPGDCPKAYSSPAVCTTAATCQGTRTDASCQQFQCGSTAVADDSACVPTTLASSCGHFADLFCTGLADQPLAQCPGACQLDSECDAVAHCDGTCQPDLANGSSCNESSDCISGHCANGFCCASGECCSVAANCPAAFSQPAQCKSPATCQGSRLDAVCVNHGCGSTTVADDSACTGVTLANECGAFLPLFCSGAAEQPTPVCPTICADDSECDAGAHCDTVCLGKVQDGKGCNEDSDCISGHCSGGLCCAQGDCCLTANGCPPSYKLYPQCDDSSTCQGHRVDATCVANVCGSLTVADDSGCGWWVLSDECSYWQPVYCVGGAVQNEPQCPVACQVDGECDPEAHCDGLCLADLQSGSGCNENSDCASSHCANGFCCAAGDCCAVAANCPAGYSAAAQCTSQSTCQGSRVEALCTANSCTSNTVPDDSACTPDKLAKECGNYLPRYCTGNANQLSPTCPNSCQGDADCLPQAHCKNSICQADKSNGKACTGNSQCLSGHCANGWCCTAGDCCFEAANCPAQYAHPSLCEEPATCQGERLDATCSGWVCGSNAVADDSGCSADVVSNECGPYKEVKCNGKVNQLPPNCPTICTFDSQCDPGFLCTGNKCQ